MNFTTHPLRIDLSWVTPWIAVGAQFAPEAVPALAAMGIGAIVDIRSETCDDAELLRQHGIALLHVPIPDCTAPDCEQLLKITDWYLTQVASGNRVFMHCRHGVGRSVMTACAALMRQGATAVSAYETVKKSRPIASLSASQFAALFAFERHLSRQPASLT